VHLCKKPVENFFLFLVFFFFFFISFNNFYKSIDFLSKIGYNGVTKRIKRISKPQKGEFSP
jgi:hypothetical protein